MIGKRKSSGLVVCLLWLLAWGVQAQEPEQNEDEQADGEAPAEAPPAAEPDKERPLMHSGLGEWGLARQYPQQAVWLELEDDSRALALFSPELETPARAGVIVLANEGQTADEGVTGALRQALSDAGMAALTLGLRAPPQALRRSRLTRNVPTPGEDGEEGEPAGENENGNAAPGLGSVMIDVASDEELQNLFDNYTNSVRTLLDAAAAELRERGYQTLVVLGVGWSADYVTQWAVGQDNLDGVAWLAPAFSPPRLADIAGLLAGERVWWLLDLHASLGVAGVQGRERAARFAREGVERYRRQAIPLASPPRRDDAARVVNRLRGRFGR